MKYGSNDIFMPHCESYLSIPANYLYPCMNMFIISGTDISERSLYIIPTAKHEPFHETLAIRTDAIQYVVDYIERQYIRTGEVVNPEGKQLVAVDATTEVEEEVNQEVPTSTPEAATTVVEKVEEVVQPAETKPVETEIVVSEESVTVEV